MKSSIFAFAISLLGTWSALSSGPSFAADTYIARGEKSITHLVSIIEMNEAFIAGLDSSDEAELNRARLNVSIARKRIAALSARNTRGDLLASAN